MSIETIVIIIVLIVLFGGGGGYWYSIDPHDRIMEEMAWLFAPYTDARTQGRVTHLNSAEMETIIDTVLDRISLYSIG
jgi:hypothetical protein